MGILNKIVNLLTGDFGAKIVGAIRDYFPPSLSDAEKRDFELKIMEITQAHEIELLKELNVAESEFNQRIKELEGTASDLRQIPVLGSIILFMRGCQRPAFGFFTLAMDCLVFGGYWTIQENSRIETAFLVINLLVLGFLFGERAIKNVIPLFEKYMKK